MSDDQAREMRPETTSEHIARDMREGRFPEQSERQMVPVLASLPHEIQVWRSMDALDHTGTWSTTRYPAEAVTYVSKADAQAAVVERFRHDLQFMVDSIAEDKAYVADKYPALFKTIQARLAEMGTFGGVQVFGEIARDLLALADADGLAAVEALRVEARENAMQALASMGQAQEAYEAQLEAEAELARVKADAQAAQAMVVERCAEFVERQGTWMQEHNLVGNGYDLVQQGKCLRALAPIDGLAMVQELRADVERLNRWRAEEGEKIKRQAKALTDLTKHCQRIEAENAGLARKIGKVQRGDGDHSQIADLEAKVINQRNELANLMARDGRLAELAADRYRLAAANAALEAKVAGLVEALAGLLCAITDTDQIGDRKLTITGGTEALRWLLDAEDAARAALASGKPGEGGE